MRTLFIALLLASAATTSAIAAQPVQNAWVTQHKGARPTREGTAAKPAPPSSPQQHVLTRPGAERAPSGAQGPAPQARHVPVERVQQHGPTVVPRTEHRPVGPLTQRRAVEHGREGTAGPVQPFEHRRVINPATQVPGRELRRPPVVSTVPRRGTEPPPRAERRSRTRPQWNMNWRNSHRYDWTQWRRSHRSVYHMRPYRDPYGWAFQMFTVGWRLWPQYYSSSYWIDDPWMYRLPPAPPGTRWIRYYNDALLVDTWTGEVIDVVHDVFW